MKKLYALTISAMLMSLSLMGQVPNGINYQAAIRNSSGEILPNEEVELKISILHETATGVEVFTETHIVTTNLQGLVNISIGSINSADFQSIDWSTPPYFISLMVNDVLLGTSQILSVPYALYASTAGNALSVEYENILNKPEFQFFWADRDGDGYGDPYSAIYAPEVPSGYVTNSDDCNDTDPNINPDAEEVIDGVDNDCDGLVDCDDPDIADTDQCNDSDNDGIANDVDNCPWVANPDQQDTDGDGLGDAWDPDIDDDGVLNDDDNCPYVFNPDQQDTDGDGLGNACDPDDDNDGVFDIDDNCPYVFNPNQQDTDGDGLGDACDPDIDNDGVPNDYDNCPYVYNPNQSDIDANGIGDACDDEISYCVTNGDCPVGFICSVEGICVLEPPQEDCSDGVDNDGDGFIDCDDPDCDTECGTDNDYDDDGVHNNVDNCPYVPNPAQQDADGDGVGDACDNCQFEPNPGQEDSNDNGIGDACEGIVDMDEDGYPSDIDCDDENPEVYPGAIDYCDGLDNDCDGEIDNDPDYLITWYQDADGDGFGNVNITIQSCIQPVGYVENSDDCDDENPDIYPFADEITDGLDNNCDGQIDENEYPFWDDDEDGILNGVDNCPNVPNPDQSDSDGDGVGDVCDNCPTTYNPNQYDFDQDNIGDACDPDKDNDGFDSDVDCNDFDPNINPGVQEVCDGVDQNCNGIVDEDAIDALQWFLDNDGDGYGDEGIFIFDCYQPMDNYVLIAGDCDDDDPDIHPDAIEIPFDGIDQNCDGLD